MKRITLTKRKFALVDDEDFEWLNQWNWYISSNGYAIRCERYGTRSEGKQHTIRMHAVINETPVGFDTEHRDLDKLNNQRLNLRTATRSQNIGNQKPRLGGTSEYKGVSWKTESNKWIAQIGANGKRNHLGYFNREGDAAIAYNNAAIKHFGEFAYLNEVTK